MRIQIVDGQAVTRTVTSRKSGKPVSFRQQIGVLRLGEYEVRRINVTLADDQAPYPVGEYELLDSSFTVDGYGNLAVARELALRPAASGSAVRPVAALAGAK